MPAVTQYLTDSNTTEYYELERVFTEEISSRAARFKRNWSYYDGDMLKPLKIGEDGVDPNVLLPKIGQVADKTVSFLIGDGVTFDSGGDGESDNVDEIIDEIWRVNRQDTLLNNIALTGAICGHVFIRVESLEDKMPRIVNLNPANCAVFWDVADYQHVLWYRIQYQVNERGPGKRIDYVQGRYNGGKFDHNYRDEWYEVVYTTAGGFEPLWKRMDEPRLLEYNWSPIIDWQNLPRPHEYYGQDDVSGAVKLNAALNFVASNFNLILKHHASPKTIGLGFDAGDVLTTEVGGLYTVNKPRPEVDLFNLEMQSDLGSSSAFMSMLSEEIWNCARMVDPRILKDRVGALTNFGLRVMYLDALKKTETKRAIYSEGLEAVTRRTLELVGIEPPNEIEIIWGDVLPTDEDAHAQTLMAEVAAGLLDKQTFAEEMGRDWEQIQSRLAADKEGQEDLASVLLRNFERGQTVQL